MYDVLVVGGNLAGTSAAINATEKGISAALIEKNKEPFNPPHCGEGIDTITASFMNLQKINCNINTIDQMILNLANKKGYVFTFQKKGLVVFDRYHLEKELQKKAKQQGTKLFIGNPVKTYNPPNEVILKDGTKLKGKIIIDASGINCIIGKAIGLKPNIRPRDIGVCIQSRVEADIDPKIMKAWFHTPYAPYGYGWVFPIDKKHANIGLGIPGGQHVDMQQLLQDYIEHEMHSNYKIQQTFRACVPSAEPLHTIVKDNVLITGDAAHLANPFLGSGIANAIYSGCLAGIIAADYLQKKIDNLELYQQLLQPKINRLTKVYQRRNKTFTNKSFIKAYAKTFFVLSLGNKLFPNFFNKQVEKVLGKDVILIRKYKETPTLF